MNEVENTKEELKQIRKHKMQGILIRSRAQIIEDDEKPSNFFCNLEKHNHSSKIIPKLDLDDGRTIKDQSEILNETKIFYEELYTCKESLITDVNLHDLLQNIEVNTLNADDSKAIEGPIRYEEAAQVLKAMSNNRSPGSDGFSAEFFLKYFGKNYIIL